MNIGLKMNYTPEISRILIPFSIGSDGIITLKQAINFREVYGSEIILLNVLNEFSVFQKILRPYRLIERIKDRKKAA